MSNFTQKGEERDKAMVISLKRPEIKEAPHDLRIPTEDTSPLPPRIEPKVQKKKVKIPRMIWVFFAATTLGLLCGAGVFWFTHRAALSSQNLSPKASEKPSQTTSDDIVKKVAKLMVLPGDEVPTIAMVSDVNVLKDQLFFKNAKNGNFVLMYAKARRAILYDAELDKVIEVAPITDGP